MPIPRVTRIETGVMVSQVTHFLQDNGQVERFDSYLEANYSRHKAKGLGVFFNRAAYFPIVTIQLPTSDTVSHNGK